MITQIIVGRGNARTAIALVRDREQRRSLANAIKGHLFPTHRAYTAAKARGVAALAAAVS